MLSIVAQSYCEPSGYVFETVSEPVVSNPDDVIIQIHAASINPIDVKKAAGLLKLAVAEQFPYKIGYDCAGTVTAVGSQVSRIRVGDRVYSRLPEDSRGSWAEYAKCADKYVALMPSGMSFPDAASLPLAAMTALQALRKYTGSLEGKTVFVPAGLSGTGSMACQLAKNVFHAGKVITTVSTAKVGKLTDLLGQGVVDQVIDYTAEDAAKEIAPQSVDFLFDTTGQAMQFLPLMVPGTGMIISVSTLPSGSQLQKSSIMQRAHSPKLPWYASAGLNLVDTARKMYARRMGVEYSYLFLQSNSEDLDTLRDYIEKRELRPVVGQQVDFRDIDEVRKACKTIYDGKGGLGKTVFLVAPSQHQPAEEEGRPKAPANVS